MSAESTLTLFEKHNQERNISFYCEAIFLIERHIIALENTMRELDKNISQHQQEMNKLQQEKQEKQKRVEYLEQAIKILDWAELWKKIECEEK